MNVEQQRAYDIILSHLDQTLRNLSPPPLRLLVYGEGGTGKSVIIRSVTDAFAKRGCLYLLIKSSYTRIAASLIDGRTCHVLAQISLGRSRKLSSNSKAKLMKMWQDAKYLIIDEYSMLSKSFLANLSKNISVAMDLNGNGNASLSFGGLSVILCGDLHQFPPVARKKTEALFYPIDLTDTHIERQIGRNIYEEFSKVVILKEQKRVSDDTWCSFLRRLRKGEVQDADLAMLRKLIIGSPQSKPVNFQDDPWSSAPLITSRHAVRKMWNKLALRKWCKKTGHHLFVCPSRDTIHDAPLTLEDRYCLAMRSKTEDSRQSNELDDEVELAIGMMIMVTTNINTDLDITNGARGKIVDIILDPHEPPLSPDPIIRLTHPPAYILVKLDRTRAPTLDGLDNLVIPIEPSCQNISIHVPLQDGGTVQKSVKRRQYPITGAYAFTDYRSQGQTIPFVIIDLASPPTGKLSLFNLYVALSRSKGRSTIRLLRDFDNKIFDQQHPDVLKDKDERLILLDNETTRWWSDLHNT